MSAVIGTGIDAVEIGRFRALLVRRPRLVQRLFSLEEQSLAKRRNDPVPTLAARFAAKEAAMKALSTGLGGVDFADVEVLAASDGSPRLWLSGRAEARAESLGMRDWHVSLTHTEILAMAVVVVA
jgi:holo-[acyl-carrier protein] synthase